MAELSMSDRQELARVVGEALVNDDGQNLAAAADMASAKELFCRHWAIVKQVLQFLAGQIGPVGWAIKAIIAAGDFLHGRICNA
jgi:predicted N-acyltransferase